MIKFTSHTPHKVWYKTYNGRLVFHGIFQTVAIRLEQLNKCKCNPDNKSMKKTKNAATVMQTIATRDKLEDITAKTIPLLLGHLLLYTVAALKMLPDTGQ